jgi:vanillate O-demethylase ferredoxin subunit
VTLSSTLQIRLRSITYEAENILGFELVALAPGQPLPAFTAGAHIDLHLSTPGGALVRSYSLLNDPRETHRYCIGVNRDPKSRGGSRHVHEALRAGQVLTISEPRNNFPLDETAPFNVFIAGGIGITPMLGMIARSQALGTPWRLHYAARTRQHAGFLDLLASYAGQPGAEVALNFDLEPGGQMLNLNRVVDALPAGAHVYCCGPLPMLEAYEQATAGLPPERVHREYFAAKEAAATGGGFTVELARSHKTLTVPEGKTILDCLIEIQVEPPFSCREGVCGTCEVRVLDGTPDHRDLVLTDAERAAGDRMMVCCSGAKTRKLVLDL